MIICQKLVRRGSTIPIGKSFQQVRLMRGVPRASSVSTGKELKFSGVYSIYNGKLQLVSTDFAGPNGIAFSPDEKFLYGRYICVRAAGYIECG